MTAHANITCLHEPTPAALAARERVMGGTFTRADAETLMRHGDADDYHLGLQVMRTLTRQANEARRENAQPVPVYPFTGADSWQSGIGNPELERDDRDATVLHALVAGLVIGGIIGAFWTILIAWWLS